MEKELSDADVYQFPSELHVKDIKIIFISRAAYSLDNPIDSGNFLNNLDTETTARIFFRPTNMN
ncbi:hypothetical protein SYJ56_03130 [Algoriphagus sp. D3-2-R+10]|uniref:hypothetical protein n=1 Tax=Algoriphagus aurantiacus TaxID=3103948 RepID=UPI002B39B242|nr:hypothetical protein [Algoriphagus sp. D3-2-R+10]MEB2774280.1 hypothetical protein [Algoriphagus sp. D3-2-R+10]